MRRWIVAAAAACALLGGVGIAADSSLQNPDFEIGKLDEAPPGWWIPAESETAGFQARVDGREPAHGAQSLRISYVGSGPPKAFGNVMQTLDATPFRGKRVRLASKLRAAAEGSARLWLRVDRPSGRMGFFDNMGDRPVTAASWTDAEIVGDIDDDAQRLALGVMLVGAGTIGADDVQLSILGDAEKQVVDPPRPLTDVGLANIIAFARLL